MNSLYLTDLSDACNLIYHPKHYHDPYQHLILRIGNGESNKNRTIFGRVMIHVDAQIFPMGVLTFYLHIRFMVTKKHANFNISDNSN